MCVNADTKTYLFIIYNIKNENSEYKQSGITVQASVMWPK